MSAWRWTSFQAPPWRLKSSVMRGFIDCALPANSTSASCTPVQNASPPAGVELDHFQMGLAGACRLTRDGLLAQAPHQHSNVE